MYAESGSLRQLRSQIRRSPDSDPALQMISGQSLFLFDQKVGTGPGTAQFYKKQSARLLRHSHGTALPIEFNDAPLVGAVEDSVSSSAEAFDGSSLIDSCLRRASLMITTLLLSLPPMPDGSANIGAGSSSAIATRTGALAIAR